MSAEDGHGLQDGDDALDVRSVAATEVVRLDARLEDDGVQHLDVFESFVLKNDLMRLSLKSYRLPPHNACIPLHSQGRL